MVTRRRVRHRAAGVTRLVLMVAFGCLGVDHVPHEVIAHLPPTLRRPRIAFVLSNEPRIPAPCERYRVLLGERLAFTVPLCAQCCDAHFNFRFPLAEACFRFVARSITGQL